LATAQQLENTYITRPVEWNWPIEHMEAIDLSGKETTDQAAWSDDGDAFCRGKDHGMEKVWGRSYEAPGVFYEEYLPAFFARRLVISEMDLADGELNWMFTGRQGGVSVKVRNDTIYFFQRYYDSFGLTPTEQPDEATLKRHPNKIFFYTSTAYSGELKSLTVRSDKHMRVQLFANGELISEQMCVMDVNLHQIRYMGQEGNICGQMQKPKAGQATLEAKLDEKHQKMLGWGGIAAVMDYYRLSTKGKQQWWELLKEYNMMIQREYPLGKKLKADYSNWDDFEYASVHYYGDNFPNGEITDFDYNKKVQDMGGIVIFEFWKLPDWMYDGQELIIGKYTEAMVNYCKTAEERTGEPPAIVGIQNEIYRKDSTLWWDMTIELREALDENGYEDVEIHMHNASNQGHGTRALKSLKQNQEAWEATDYTCSNQYDYQEFYPNPDGFDEEFAEFAELSGDKPFISTELCINWTPYQVPSYRLAMTLGQHYHKNLVIQDAVSIMYCWLLLNSQQPSYTYSRTLCTIDEENGFVPEESSYQLRMFGAYSRHIFEGYERYTLESPDDDLLVSGYTDGEKNTIVLINRGTEPLEADIPWGFEYAPSVELCDPYHQNELIHENLPVENNRVSITIDGGQAITLF
jgi:hypothetical protein